MLIQLTHKNPEFFLAQIRESEQSLSEEERCQLLMEIFKGRAANYRSPGIEQLGRVKMRTVGYLRNSVGKLDKSVSIPRQLEKFLDYCARNNLVPVGVYADPDTSGTTVVQRPGLMRMMIDVRAGKVDVIVAESPDRIGRAMSSISMTWDAIKRHNVPLINLHDGQPLTDQTVMIHGFMAANEHSRIKARTKDGARRRARDNKTITKPLAYGHYRAYPRGEVQKHPVQARIVRESYDLYMGGLTEVHLEKMYNKKWLAGDKDYEPPHRADMKRKGKALLWRAAHFITNHQSESRHSREHPVQGHFRPYARSVR